MISRLFRVGGSRSMIAACVVLPFVLSASVTRAVEPGGSPSASKLESLPDAPAPNLSERFDLADRLEETAGVSPPNADVAPPTGAPAENFFGVFGTKPPTAPQLTTRELDEACQTGKLHGKPCRAKWFPILWEAFQFTAVDNAGNIALDGDTRHDLRYNPYWATYTKCVVQYRYKQWSDDTTFVVHDIGHPMQGAIADSIFEQNDPSGRGIVFSTKGNYIRSRLKAMAFTSFFEVQWKIGPVSEASIGNSGLNTYSTPSVKGRTTNETGFQDFVITPVYGTGWNVMEDAIDRYVMPHIWARTHNRVVLSLLFWMTPCKSAANFLRYKPFYYRDYTITPLR